MAISLLSRAVLGALIALLCVAAPAGAHESERDLLRAEARVLGPEHAREHAALRRLERLGVETAKPTRPPLASSGTVFSSSIAAERSLGDTGGPSAAVSPEDTLGRWQPPFKIPVMAINAALLPTGKVLWYSYPANPNLIAAGPDAPNTAQAWLWDPVTGHTKRVDPPLWLDPRDGVMKPANIWCSGTSFLIDGRVVVAGGNLQYRRNGVNEFKGLDTAFTFDPFSETWTRQPDMEKGRWYPTQARLPNGKTVILSGLDETGDLVDYPTNKQIEVFTPSPESDLRGVGTLAKMSGDRQTLGNPPDGGLYPHAFWMPSGRLLIAGPDENDSWFLNSADTSQPLSGQWTSIFPQQSRYRVFGSAVQLPNALGAGASTKVMQIGGWSDSQTPHRTASTETLDESTLPGTTWQTDTGKQLNIARAHQNTVLLPDGSMVTVGGGIGKDDDGIAPDLQQWGAEPDQKKVELWDPTTGTWSYGAAQAEYRTYHSTAILLPDGRVVSAGDDYNGGFDQDTAEIYEPPYLFKGPRPVISSAPQVAILEDSLEVATPDPAAVDHAALVAPGATTHANDMNQRYYALNTTPGAGKVSMDLPDEDSVPPGWYMLFLLSDEGVPSIAHWIRIGHAGTPQPGQIVIEQGAQPSDANPFSFSGAPFTDFDLTPGETRSATVLAGEYEVAQAVEPGYDLTSMSCDDGALTPSSTDTATRRATVRVSAGEIVRCTVTNIKRATLTVEQRVQPPNGVFSFGGSLGAFDLADTQTRSFDLAPGEYSVTQGARSGFSLSSVACNDSDSSSSLSGGSLTARLSPGEQLTCSFSSRDSKAPVVRFSGLNRRKKTLTGNATDLAGVTKLSAALSQKAGRKCRWWSPRRHGFARRATACSKPAFMRASLRRTSTGRSWRVALKGLPRAGRYRVVTSATDALGNIGRPSFSRRVRRR